MAEKGRGKKVRFQGGTVFPAAVALVVVLGVLLIAYSRSSSYANAPGPRASDRDHFHIAFGIYNCDAFAPNMAGNGEQSPRYPAYGVHSHDDGVIHYHPTTGASSGRNAKLKRFLEVYDVSLTNDKLTLPADQAGLTLEEGVDKCTDASGNQVDGQLKVVVWNDASNASDFTTITANMDDARITQDGMAMVIAFVPEGSAVPLPEAAANLAALGAADSGTPVTTVAGDTATTVAGTTDTSAVATGEPSDSTTPDSGVPVGTDAPPTVTDASPTTIDAPATTS